MVESGKVRADRFVLIACGAFALVMTVLTSVRPRRSPAPASSRVFIVLGLAPYGSRRS